MQDPNVWFLYKAAIKDPKKFPRAMIVIPKNLPIRWRKKY
jgi:hypothetical protein